MNPGAVIVDGALWVAIPVAILAGLVSFVSPCVLPLVPGYLGYLGSTTTTTAAPTLDGGRTVTAERARLLLGVTLFIAGFTVVFVAVTILGGTFGYLLLQYANVLTRVFGVVIIALGLVFVLLIGEIDLSVAAEELGLRVPKDLSVVGFDDLTLISTNLDPLLTTMRLPHWEMGEWLTRELAAGRARELPELILFPCPLIERASTAPPAA